MQEWIAALPAALWLGLLTSISPCPLATNIAAVSYLGRRLECQRSLLWGGVFYTAGRSVVYTLLGALLTAGLLAAPRVSMFLQSHVNQFLGPVLTLAGMALLGLLPLGAAGGREGGGRWMERLRGQLEGSGALTHLWGALALGALFALAFCPVSAALFFGGLMPLAVRAGSWALLPLLYGVGTAAPVLFFAVALALGARAVGGAFQRIQTFERWARHATGVVFILIGIYMIWKYLILG